MVVGLQCLAHDTREIGSEPREVHLRPEPRGKAVDHPRCVVPRSVEAPIDEGLNPAAQRVEQCRRSQSGPCHRQRIAAAHQRSESQDGTGVHRYQDDGNDRVGDGATDEPINLIEAIAEDGHADGERQEADGYGEGDVGFNREVRQRLEEVLGRPVSAR